MKRTAGFYWCYSSERDEWIPVEWIDKMGGYWAYWGKTYSNDSKWLLIGPKVIVPALQDSDEVEDNEEEDEI